MHGYVLCRNASESWMLYTYLNFASAPLHRTFVYTLKNRFTVAETYGFWRVPGLYCTDTQLSHVENTYNTEYDCYQHCEETAGCDAFMHSNDYRYCTLLAGCVTATMDTVTDRVSFMRMPGIIGSAWRDGLYLARATDTGMPFNNANFRYCYSSFSWVVVCLE